MSEYDKVSRGTLRLKGVAQSGIKKKKKKDKLKVEEHLPQNKEEETSEKESPVAEKAGTVYKTKAEMAFIHMREKKQKERILQKASRTHKQRVEEFNRHLDNLTEHFDIPKVSWTK